MIVVDGSIAMGDHVVHFYPSEEELVDLVGGHLADALEADETVIVIATAAHRRAFESRIRAAGVDLDRAKARASFCEYDARSTMARFIEDGEIDRTRFAGSAGALVQSAVRRGRPVYVYGEMVALLWADGRVTTAIELEEEWNLLQRSVAFTLICAYPTESVSSAAASADLELLCQVHTTVLAPLGSATPAATDSLASVTRSFSPALTAPGSARRFVAQTLAEWGVDDLTDDAALVVTELSSNAVRHARSRFTVEVTKTSLGLRIAVRDDSPVAPTRQTNSLDAPDGRGLNLVAALAGDWGVCFDDPGKIVWAELVQPEP